VVDVAQEAITKGRHAGGPVGLIPNRIIAQSGVGAVAVLSEGRAARKA
jgi:hypothetical protein